MTGVEIEELIRVLDVRLTQIHRDLEAIAAALADLVEHALAVPKE